MKTIVLSFDDARSDFYSRAFPIMRQYGIPSTLNVITKYLSDEPGYKNILKHGEGITTKALRECHKSGLVEIACHGANHKNNKRDIEKNIIELRRLGINEPVFGFASPGCGITEQNKNDNGVWNLVERGELLYVRSGMQIRRENYVYIALSFLDRYIHSSWLYAYLNRRNIITQKEHLNEHILPAITIYSYTKLSQIKYLIGHMPDSSTAILMLHSILRKGDEGYGYDRFCWDADLFESLCVWLIAQDDIQLCMTKDLFT